jgi:basic membrane lipoprotein Med (substrate-binding protein (PBP1-ABC) superfamily)
VVAVACAGDDGDVTSDDGTAEPVTTTEPAPVVASTSEGPAPTTPREPLRIGLVAPSATDDASFTQSMVDSLERVAARRPLEVTISDELPRSDQALEAGAAFADDGVDLVILHGSQYLDALERLAADHPDVSFAWGTAVSSIDLPNVYTYTARADEGGYVNGVIAASLTASGLVGAVGPVQVGDAGRYLDGFLLGASATDPAVEVSVNFIDSYSDAELAAEATTAMADFGADVLTGTSQIVSGPIGVAVARRLPWLGTQSDPGSLAPRRVVAAQVYHWEVALGPALDAIEEDGSGGGALEPLTLANGGLTIEFNDGFDLPEGIRRSADEAIAGLTDGTIDTGVS